jgi:hypothetical protein
MAGEAMTFDELDMSAFQFPLVTGEEDDDNNQDDDAGFVSLEKQQKTVTSTDNKDTDQGAESSEENSEGVGNKDGEDDSNDDSKPDPYSSFAKALAEEGVLPSLDLKTTKITSADDLIEAVRKEIEISKYANLNDKQKAYLKALENGIPEQEFTQVQSGIDMLEKISAEEVKENGELRKQLILSDFLAKGIPQEKALKLTERSIAIGEDEADALDALESLKAVQKQELEKTIAAKEAERLAKQEEEKQQLLKFKQTIMDTKEIIPGVKINNKVAEKVFEQAVKPVHQLPDGRMVNAVVKARLDNPIDFETKLNYLFYYTKGFTDFSKIATSQKTKATQELDDLVKGNTFAPKASGMNGDLDFTPPEFKGAFDASILNNII